jgi:hypothetical protein
MKPEKSLLSRGQWAESNNCHDASDPSAAIANHRDQAKFSAGNPDGIFADGTRARPCKTATYGARRRSSGSEGIFRLIGIQANFFDGKSAGKNRHASQNGILPSSLDHSCRE